MTDLVQVCEAVKDRLEPVLPDFNPYLLQPSPMTKRAFCVEGDPARAAEYADGPSNFNKWYLKISLFAVANAELQTIRDLSALTATDGPIRRVLRDEDIDDDLGRITAATGHFVQVTQLGEWRQTRRNGSKYRQALVDVCVGTN